MPHRSARPRADRRSPGWQLTALLVLLLLLPGGPAPARDEVPGATGAETAAAGTDDAGAAEPSRLPPASNTAFTLDLGERRLAFEATAGSLTLGGDRGGAEAEIAFVAYRLTSDAPVTRPVTFAVNGGPGAASAYLHLGVLGPWRLPVGAAAIQPSQATPLVANGETWLDFTDLVFLDPVGTGFSRLIDRSERVVERYLSVEGDIEALAEAVYRWLVEHGRVASPKYFIGESYGGFRGPLLAEKLRGDYGIAFSGMTLLSPVLDFGWRDQPGHAPLPRVSLLPSLAAAAMEAAAGEVDAGAIAAVEAYATGDYVSDLLDGLVDTAATARVVRRVAAITGLDPATIEAYAGRLEPADFARELRQGESRIASLYDTAVSALDPTPERPFSRGADPLLEGLMAPLTSAVLDHYGQRLGWLPERRYRLLNESVNRRWRWATAAASPRPSPPCAAPSPSTPPCASSSRTATPTSSPRISNPSSSSASSSTPSRPTASARPPIPAATCSTPATGRAPRSATMQAGFTAWRRIERPQSALNS